MAVSRRCCCCLWAAGNGTESQELADRREERKDNVLQGMRTPVTKKGSVLKPRRLKIVQAQECNFETALAKMKERFKFGEAHDFRIGSIILNKLVSTVGGSIIVICPENIARMLQTVSLDDDALAELLKQSRDAKREQSVEIVLEAFLEHSKSDRWERVVVISFLEQMNIEGVGRERMITRLIGQPKDGALVLSQFGEFFFAAVKLEHSDGVKHTIKTHDGKAVGTRHGAGLGVTEFVGDLDEPEAVTLVSSDAGGVMLMIPDKARPGVFALGTNEVLLPCVKVDGTSEELRIRLRFPTDAKEAEMKDLREKVEAVCKLVALRIEAKRFLSILKLEADPNEIEHIVTFLSQQNLHLCDLDRGAMIGLAYRWPRSSNLHTVLNSDTAYVKAKEIQKLEWRSKEEIEVTFTFVGDVEEHEAREIVDEITARRICRNGGVTYARRGSVVVRSSLESAVDMHQWFVTSQEPTLLKRVVTNVSCNLVERHLAFKDLKREIVLSCLQEWATAFLDESDGDVDVDESDGDVDVEKRRRSDRQEEELKIEVVEIEWSGFIVTGGGEEFKESHRLLLRRKLERKLGQL